MEIQNCNMINAPTNVKRLKPSDPLASRFQCIFYDHSARPWVIHRDIGTVSLRSFGLPPADCKSNQFRNASDFKLLLDVHTVYFRRFNADAQLLSDLFRGSPLADQLENFELAIRQRLHRRSARFAPPGYRIEYLR